MVINYERYRKMCIANTVRDIWPYSICMPQVPDEQRNRNGRQTTGKYISFVELTADVLEIFFQAVWMILEGGISSGPSDSSS